MIIHTNCANFKDKFIKTLLHETFAKPNLKKKKSNKIRQLTFDQFRDGVRIKDWLVGKPLFSPLCRFHITPMSTADSFFV